jgi:Fic family protein
METVLEGIFQGKKRHPIKQGALFYSFFQKVRPFQFGNGLTARVLMKHLITEASTCLASSSTSTRSNISGNERSRQVKGSTDLS